MNPIKVYKLFLLHQFELIDDIINYCIDIIFKQVKVITKPPLDIIPKSYGESVIYNDVKYTSTRIITNIQRILVGNDKMQQECQNILILFGNIYSTNLCLFNDQLTDFKVFGEIKFEGSYGQQYNDDVKIIVYDDVF